MKESCMSDNYKSLDFIFPNKETNGSYFDLVGIFQRSQVKKFTVQKCGPMEENQRRAHDFHSGLQEKKVMEARRQNELHQRVREKYI